MPDTDTPAWAEELTNKLAKLVRKTEEQIRIQNFANLGPERVVTLNHQGTPYEMYLPFGDQDYIQRRILETRDFYESPQLVQLHRMNLIPEGGVIIDAGSNIGNHAVFFNAHFKPDRMYCFEPQALAYRTLQRNIELNAEGADIRCVQAMLGAEEGTGAVASYKQGNQGGAKFEQSDTGSTPMLTLDTALEGADKAKVSFIKIDVEGFQAEVLRGAHDILSTSKPILWIEVFDDEKDETNEILAQYGYSIQPLTKNNYLYTIEG